MLSESSGFESDVLADMALPQVHHSPHALKASQVAQAYEKYVEGLWGGEPGAPAFCGWLTPYWRTTLPPVPASSPDATSPHAAGGRGIRWYDTPAGVIGYVAGMRSGYQIPSNVSMPAYPDSQGVED